MVPGSAPQALAVHDLLACNPLSRDGLESIVINKHSHYVCGIHGLVERGEAHVGQPCQLLGQVLDVRLDSDLKTAQLGLIWANCLNARFLVSNARRTAGGQVRRLRAVFTPMDPGGSEALYTISTGGIAAVQ